MRTTRLRQKIKKFLDVRGEANTTEILEHVNSTMRHGTTPQQLGNVLSKDKDIMKVEPQSAAGPSPVATRYASGNCGPVPWTRTDQFSSSKFQLPLRARLFILALCANMS